MDGTVGGSIALGPRQRGKRERPALLISPMRLDAGDDVPLANQIAGTIVVVGDALFVKTQAAQTFDIVAGSQSKRTCGAANKLLA